MNTTASPVLRLAGGRLPPRSDRAARRRAYFRRGLPLVVVLCAPLEAARASPPPEPRGPSTSSGPTVVELRAADGDGLRLAPPRNGSPPRTPLGAGWRHELDIVLTVDGDDLVVRDGTQVRRVFPDAAADTGAGDRVHDGRRSADGQLAVQGGRHVWRRGDDTTVTFAGSLPVRLESPDGAVTTLRYTGGRLVEAVRADGATTRFAHDAARLSGVTFPDGTAYSTRVDADGTLTVRRRSTPHECGPDDEAPIERCDAARPPPPSFADPGIPGATRVDARPASCGSYFVEHHGTERGTAIETGLEGLPHYAGFTATVRSFPVADFVGAELRVVRSRDLSRPTYDTVPDGLLARLLRDGDQITRGLLEPLARDGALTVGESGRTTTLLHRPERPVVLELVVRHGIASADQIRQITRARLELHARHGIRLRVIEIP